MRVHDAILVVVLVVLIVILAMVLALSTGVAGSVFGGAGRRRKKRFPVPAQANDFPYWRKTLPPASEMFDALKASGLETAEGLEGPVLLRTYPADYRRADAISNHFTEEARIDCRGQNRPSPREAWQKVRSRSKGLSPEEQREKVYEATYECNTFNPEFARWIILETAGKNAKVLDPSAGWGDRLIGALAADAAQYHGYDPNPRLQTGYTKIINELGDGEHTKFKVNEDVFESVCLDPSYDLVLTSPPYYSYEEYVAPGREGAREQSANRYQTYEEWADKMYKPYLANAYRAAKPGGWVVIYIEDVRQKGRVYPLRILTEGTMAELGAESARNFGLLVSFEGVDARKSSASPNLEKTRWALTWRKPS